MNRPGNHLPTCGRKRPAPPIKEALGKTLWLLFLVLATFFNHPGLAELKTPPKASSGSLPVVSRCFGSVRMTHRNQPVLGPLEGKRIGPEDTFQLESGAVLEVNCPDGQTRVFLGRRFLMGATVLEAAQGGPATQHLARSSPSALENVLVDLRRVLERKPERVVGGVRGYPPDCSRIGREMEDALSWVAPMDLLDTPISPGQKRDLEAAVGEVLADCAGSPAWIALPRLAAVFQSYGQHRSIMEMLRVYLSGQDCHELLGEEVNILWNHLRDQFLPLTVRLVHDRRDLTGNPVPWPGEPLQVGESVRFKFSTPFPVYWALIYWDGRTLYRTDPAGRLDLPLGESGALEPRHPKATAEKSGWVFTPSTHFAPDLYQKVDEKTPGEVFYVVATAERDVFDRLRRHDRPQLEALSQNADRPVTSFTGSVVLRMAF